jgi:hypothetical protein
MRRAWAEALRRMVLTARALPHPTRRSGSCAPSRRSSSVACGVRATRWRLAHPSSSDDSTTAASHARYNASGSSSRYGSCILRLASRLTSDMSQLIGPTLITELRPRSTGLGNQVGSLRVARCARESAETGAVSSGARLPEDEVLGAPNETATGLEQPLLELVGDKLWIARGRTSRRRRLPRRAIEQLHNKWGQSWSRRR